MPQPMKTPSQGDWTQKEIAIVNNSADVFTLLDRLDKVKKTGAGRWLACCPAHDDRSPSLSIRETEDGTILVKCWTGCGAADVMVAVGMSLSELFPQREREQHRKPMRLGERWVPRDVLSAIAREALITLLAAEAVQSGTPLSDDDLSRLAVAAGRLRAAAKEVGVHV